MARAAPLRRGLNNNGQNYSAKARGAVRCSDENEFLTADQAPSCGVGEWKKRCEDCIYQESEI